MSAARPMPCPQCGYDLRGHAREGLIHCPECGVETTAGAIQSGRKTAWRRVDTALLLTATLPGIAFAGVLTTADWAVSLVMPPRLDALALTSCVALIVLSSSVLAWVGSDRFSSRRRIVHAILAPIVVLAGNYATLLLAMTAIAIMDASF